MEDLTGTLNTLLGRESISADIELMAACVRDKSVLVTGAGGSIGSELCRELIKLQPKCIILYEHSEIALYAIESEIQEMAEGINGAPGINVVQVLGSIKNKLLVEKIIQRFDVDTVYHAAAYKQVPMLERNVIAGIENNIFGTLILAKAAIKYKVESFVLISTDKAVRPSSIMGATKRIAEQILQSLNALGCHTCFSMVRFGNVLGSSGSVIPLFCKQIRTGGPVTVTHPEVSRYFMTATEAAQLVLQASTLAKGGEVFVLDMHEPIRIADLAKELIDLLGFEFCRSTDSEGCSCNKKIHLKYTGLRNGEKLVEELLIGNSVTETSHPNIMRVNEDFQQWAWLESLLARLDFACKRAEPEKIRTILSEAIEGAGIVSTMPTDNLHIMKGNTVSISLPSEIFSDEETAALSH